MKGKPEEIEALCMKALAEITRRRHRVEAAIAKAELAEKERRGAEAVETSMRANLADANRQLKEAQKFLSALVDGDFEHCAEDEQFGKKCLKASAPDLGGTRVTSLYIHPGDTGSA